MSRSRRGATIIINNCAEGVVVLTERPECVCVNTQRLSTLIASVKMKTLTERLERPATHSLGAVVAAAAVVEIYRQRAQTVAIGNHLTTFPQHQSRR